MTRPPRLPERILSSLLPADDRDEILGDLSEAYSHRHTSSPASAAVWYWLQLLLVPAWLIRAAATSLRFDPAEVRRSVRSLIRAPGFTIVAVVSLGLGIGATAAIAGAINALLLVTLPVDSPEQLSLVYHSWPDEWDGGQYGSSSSEDLEGGRQLHSNISWPAYTTLHRAAGPDVAVSGYAFVRELSVVRGTDPALAAAGMLVTGDYFETLRLGVHLGRPLAATDDEVGAAPVAVLSHDFWQRAFGGDRSVVGESLRLNGTRFEVVGVAPAGYVGLSPGGFFGPSDVIVPISHHDTFLSIGVAEGESLQTDALRHWVRLIARVPEGLSWNEVEERWTGLVRREMVEAGVFTEGVADDMSMRLLEGRRGLDSLRTTTAGPLRILSLTVVLVLLIACANLTTLLLARGAARSEEMALRRAIGASRWELARPQIVESALLGLLGGGLGFLIALEGGPLLVSSLTDGSGAAAVRYEVSWPFVTATALAALAAAGVSGWLPALRIMRTEPSSHLGGRSQGGASRRFGAARLLIGAQIAISVPLVVAAGLFLQTLGNLTSVDPGFDAEGLTVFRADASLVTRDRTEQNRIYERILSDVGRISGVEHAAIVENVLVSGWRSNTSVTVDDTHAMMDMNAVSPGFFETMRISHLSGRMLSSDDLTSPTPVAVVNEAAERRLFGGSAVGRTFTLAGRGRTVTVVGVVSDVKYGGLRQEIEPAFFDPWLQRPGGLYSVHFVLRTSLAAPVVDRAVRAVVADIDPALPVSDLRSQSDDLRARAARERVFARLLTVFGGFGLLLSCIGLHGLTAFSVAQRTAEMGIRRALGATQPSIVRMVLSRVVVLTTVGLALGLVAALQVGPIIGSMLYGVDARSIPILAVAAVVMMASAVIAGAVPALRAARVDPLESLSARS